LEIVYARIIFTKEINDMKATKKPEAMQIEKEIQKVNKLAEQEAKSGDFNMASNYRAMVVGLEKALYIINNIHKLKH
jgi:excinuclease UvrABC helicase subunit UvrB